MGNEALEVSVKLAFDGKSVKQSMDSVESQMSSLGSKLGSTAKVAGKAIGIGIAAGAAVAKVAITKLGTEAIKAYGDFEQLSDGMKKIFNDIDYSKIEADASDAWRTMNISAAQYMEAISGVGATFAQTMGDARGYETAKTGMQALADYASGTGKSVDTLMEKYQAISRSTTSYLSIADQFAGILPQTTDGFLEQAKAAGYLNKSYTRLNQVPVAEYQEALTKLIQDGVKEMGLAGNTAEETAHTITGSINALKSAGQDLVAGLADPNADLEALMRKFGDALSMAVENVVPAFTKAIKGIAQVIRTGLPKLIRAIPSILKEILPDLIAATVELLVALAEALPEFVPIIVQGIVQLVEALVPYLPTIFGAIAQAIIILVVELIKGLYDLVKEFITNVGTWLAEGMSRACEHIAMFFTDLWQNIVDGAKSVWEGIVSIFSGLAQFFGDIFSNAWNKVKQVFSTGGKIFDGIKDGIVNAFKAIVNAIIRGINKVVSIPFNAINGILDTLRGVQILDIKPFEWVGRIDVPQIPELAMGGFATGKSLATIGEAGKEAVLPLERNTEWASLLANVLADEFESQDRDIGGNITVYMTNEINNEMDADDIGRRLMQSIRRAS